MLIVILIFLVAIAIGLYFLNKKTGILTSILQPRPHGTVATTNRLEGLKKQVEFEEARAKKVEDELKEVEALAKQVKDEEDKLKSARERIQNAQSKIIGLRRGNENNY